MHRRRLRSIAVSGLLALGIVATALPTATR